MQELKTIFSFNNFVILVDFYFFSLELRDYFYLFLLGIRTQSFEIYKNTLHKLMRAEGNLNIREITKHSLYLASQINIASQAGFYKESHQSVCTERILESEVIRGRK